MTQQEIESALPGLRRSLGLGEEADALLTDALNAAAEEIERTLGFPYSAGFADCLLTELAALKYYALGANAANVKSSSYSEGQLSQSTCYFTPQELQEGQQAILRSLAPFRRVRCGRHRV